MGNREFGANKLFRRAPHDRVRGQRLPGRNSTGLLNETESWRVAPYSVVRGSSVLVGVSRKYKFANREIGVPGELAPLGLMDGVLTRL